MGSMSVMGFEERKQIFRPLIPDVDFITFNNEADLEKITTKTAGIILETIQGGAGFDSVVTTILFTDAIWAAGNFTDYNGTTIQRLIKLDVTGAVDPTYDATTGANSQITKLNKFSDGAVVLTGNLTTYKGTTVNRITCIQPDGTIDSTFVSGTGLNQVPAGTTIIKNDIVYLNCNTSSLVTYKGASGSRFVAIDRQGNRITNYGIAGTDIPSFFYFDVDNLGRVYIAYRSADTERVIVERWLPSGVIDPTYFFEHPLPNLSLYPSIKVNDSYECFVAICDTLLDTTYLIKVRSSAQLDMTFGTNIIAYTGTGASSLVINIKDDAVYLPLNNNNNTTTYNGTNVKAL
jgi:hypothetical protein